MGNVLNLYQAKSFCDQMREEGRTIVLTNGIFDLIHVGHLDYLEKARELGDSLIVGLNCDDTAKELKGEAHPIIPQEERAQLLAALNVVDAVVIFKEPTADHLIEQLEPDFYVKGGDYAAKVWPERETALRIGAKVKLISFTQGRSTTNLIQTIVERFGSHDTTG